MFFPLPDAKPVSPNVHHLVIQYIRHVCTTAHHTEKQNEYKDMLKPHGIPSKPIMPMQAA
jgi:hypothetical protein